jgi:cell division septal protein FtsQ
MFKFSSKNKNKVVRLLPGTTTNRRIISGKKKQAITSISKSGIVSLLLWFLILAFLGVIIYTLFFSPLLAIKSINVIGVQNIDKQSIINIVTADIEGKYMNVFTKNNIILASRNKIEMDLHNKFKRIEDVEITTKFPDKLLIKIKEWESMLVFCSEDQCFVIDKNGRAYAHADFEANELGENDLSILRDISRKTISIKNFSVDVGLVQFISDVKNKLEQELDIKVEQEIQTPMLISGDLQFKTVNNYLIYFSRDIGASKSIEMLKTALNNSINKDSVADLEYIDLRLDNKVYYKLKTNPVVVTETEQSLAVPAETETKKKK